MKLKLYLIFAILLVEDISYANSFKKNIVCHLTPTLPSNNFVIDPELRYYSMKMLKPIFEINKIEADNIGMLFYISDDINAFTGINRTVCIYKGLIMKLSLEAFLGVMAHETGHLACLHIDRNIQVMAEMKNKILSINLFSLLLAGTGAGGPLFAKLAGEHLLISSYLSYSRRHEYQADDIALRTLDNLNWPITGLIKAYETFKNLKEDIIQAQRNSGNYSILENPYWLTHPVPEDRLQRIKLFIKKYKKSKNNKLPKEFQLFYDLMRAKIKAYTIIESEIKKTMELKFLGKDENGDYKLLDTAYYYYLSILNMRVDRYKKAHELIDLAITKTEDQGVQFFFKLHKAQIYKNQGDAKKVIATCRPIIEHASKWTVNAETLLFYIYFLLDANKAKYTKEAVNYLDKIGPPKHKWLEVYYWHLKNIVNSRQKAFGWVLLGTLKINILNKKYRKAKKIMAQLKKYLSKNKGKIKNYKQFEILLKDAKKQFDEIDYFL